MEYSRSCCEMLWKEKGDIVLWEVEGESCGGREDVVDEMVGDEVGLQEVDVVYGGGGVGE